MDNGDIASEFTDFSLNLEIQKIKVYEGEAATECDECGEPIPLKRREALKGVRVCVDCQEALEKTNG